MPKTIAQIIAEAALAAANAAKQNQSKETYEGQSRAGSSSMQMQRDQRWSQYVKQKAQSGRSGGGYRAQGDDWMAGKSAAEREWIANHPGAGSGGGGSSQPIEPERKRVDWASVNYGPPAQQFASISADAERSNREKLKSSMRDLYSTRVNETKPQNFDDSGLLDPRLREIASTPDKSLDYSFVNPKVIQSASKIDSSVGRELARRAIDDFENYVSPLSRDEHDSLYDLAYPDGGHYKDGRIETKDDSWAVGSATLSAGEVTKSLLGPFPQLLAAISNTSHGVTTELGYARQRQRISGIENKVDPNAVNLDDANKIDPETFDINKLPAYYRAQVDPSSVATSQYKQVSEQVPDGRGGTMWQNKIVEVKTDLAPDADPAKDTIYRTIVDRVKGNLDFVHRASEAYTPSMWLNEVLSVPSKVSETVFSNLEGRPYNPKYGDTSLAAASTSEGDALVLRVKQIESMIGQPLDSTVISELPKGLTKDVQDQLIQTARQAGANPGREYFQDGLDWNSMSRSLDLLGVPKSRQQEMAIQLGYEIGDEQTVYAKIGDPSNTSTRSYKTFTVKNPERKVSYDSVAAAGLSFMDANGEVVEAASVPDVLFEYAMRDDLSKSRTNGFMDFVGDVLGDVTNYAPFSMVWKPMEIVFEGALGLGKLAVKGLGLASDALISAPAKIINRVAGNAIIKNVPEHLITDTARQLFTETVNSSSLKFARRVFVATASVLKPDDMFGDGADNFITFKLPQIAEAARAGDKLELIMKNGVSPTAVNNVIETFRSAEKFLADVAVEGVKEGPEESARLAIIKRAKGYLKGSGDEIVEARKVIEDRINEAFASGHYDDLASAAHVIEDVLRSQADDSATAAGTIEITAKLLNEGQMAYGNAKLGLKKIVETSVASDVNRMSGRIWGAWTNLVLTLRPGWQVVNYIDNTFRMLTNGDLIDLSGKRGGVLLSSSHAEDILSKRYGLTRADLSNAIRRYYGDNADNLLSIMSETEGRIFDPVATTALNSLKRYAKATKEGGVKGLGSELWSTLKSVQPRIEGGAAIKVFTREYSRVFDPLFEQISRELPEGLIPSVAEIAQKFDGINWLNPEEKAYFTQRMLEERVGLQTGLQSIAKDMALNPKAYVDAKSAASAVVGNRAMAFRTFIDTAMPKEIPQGDLADALKDFITAHLDGVNWSDDNSVKQLMDLTVSQADTLLGVERVVKTAQKATETPPTMSEFAERELVNSKSVDTAKVTKRADDLVAASRKAQDEITEFSPRLSEDALASEAKNFKTTRGMYIDTMNADYNRELEQAYTRLNKKTLGYEPSRSGAMRDVLKKRIESSANPEEKAFFQDALNEFDKFDKTVKLLPTETRINAWQKAGKDGKGLNLPYRDYLREIETRIGKPLENYTWEDEASVRAYLNKYFTRNGQVFSNGTRSNDLIAVERYAQARLQLQRLVDEGAPVKIKIGEGEWVERALKTEDLYNRNALIDFKYKFGGKEIGFDFKKTMKTNKRPAISTMEYIDNGYIESGRTIFKVTRGTWSPVIDVNSQTDKLVRLVKHDVANAVDHTPNLNRISDDVERLIDTANVRASVAQSASPVLDDLTGVLSTAASEPVDLSDYVDLVAAQGEAIGGAPLPEVGVAKILRESRIDPSAKLNAASLRDQLLGVIKQNNLQITDEEADQLYQFMVFTANANDLSSGWELGTTLSRVNKITGEKWGGEAVFQKQNLDTPEFKKFFDGSKATSDMSVSGTAKSADNGALVMYHGTPSGGFDSFDMSKANSEGLYGPGIYLTDSAGTASGYSQTRSSIGMTRIGDDRLSQIVSDMNEMADSLASADPDGAVDLRSGIDEFKSRISGGISAQRTLEVANEIDKKYGMSNMLADSVTKIAGDKASTVYPFFVSIKNPFEIEGAVTDYKTLENIYKNLEGNGQKRFRVVMENRLRQNGSVSNESIYSMLTDIGSTKSGNIEWSNKAFANDILQKSGYDGITHVGGAHTGNASHRVFIAFEPGQVKSAIANRGSWDRANPSMLFQEADVPNIRTGWISDEERAANMAEALPRIKEMAGDKARAAEGFPATEGKVIDGAPLFSQSGDGFVKGYNQHLFDPNDIEATKSLIGLLQGADADTAFEEWSHHLFKMQEGERKAVMYGWAKAPKDDVTGELLSHYDVAKEINEITLNPVMSAEQVNRLKFLREVEPAARKADEQLVKAFRKYVMVGIAPNSKIKEVFEQVKQMLIRSWQSVKAYASIKITPELRSAFDDMLGADKDYISEQMKPLMKANAYILEKLPTDLSDLRKIASDVSGVDLNAGIGTVEVGGRLMVAKPNIRPNVSDDMRKNVNTVISRLEKIGDLYSGGEGILTGEYDEAVQRFALSAQKRASDLRELLDYSEKNGLNPATAWRSGSFPSIGGKYPKLLQDQRALMELEKQRTSVAGLSEFGTKTMVDTKTKVKLTANKSANLMEMIQKGDIDGLMKAYDRNMTLAGGKSGEGLESIRAAIIAVQDRILKGEDTYYDALTGKAVDADKLTALRTYVGNEDMYRALSPGIDKAYIAAGVKKTESGLDFSNFDIKKFKIDRAMTKEDALTGIEDQIDRVYNSIISTKVDGYEFAPIPDFSKPIREGDWEGLTDALDSTPDGKIILSRIESDANAKSLKKLIDTSITNRKKATELWDSISEYLPRDRAMEVSDVLEAVKVKMGERPSLVKVITALRDDLKELVNAGNGEIPTFSGIADKIDKALLVPGREVPTGVLAQADEVAPGMIRLYRGVKSNAVKTEFSKKLSKEESNRYKDILDRMIDSGYKPTAEEMNFINSGFYAGRDKFYSPTYESALRYAKAGGVVYYIDVPKSDAKNWMKMSGNWAVVGGEPETFLVPNEIAMLAKEYDPINVHPVANKTGISPATEAAPMIPTARPSAGEGVVASPPETTASPMTTATEAVPVIPTTGLSAVIGVETSSPSRYIEDWFDAMKTAARSGKAPDMSMFQLLSSDEQKRVMNWLGDIGKKVADASHVAQERAGQRVNDVLMDYNTTLGIDAFLTRGPTIQSGRLEGLEPMRVLGGFVPFAKFPRMNMLYMIEQLKHRPQMVQWYQQYQENINAERRAKGLSEQAMPSIPIEMGDTSVEFNPMALLSGKMAVNAFTGYVPDYLSPSEKFLAQVKNLGFSVSPGVTGVLMGMGFIRPESASYFSVVPQGQLTSIFPGLPQAIEERSPLIASLLGVTSPGDSRGIIKQLGYNALSDIENASEWNKKQIAKEYIQAMQDQSGPKWDTASSDYYDNQGGPRVVGYFTGSYPRTKTDQEKQYQDYKTDLTTLRSTLDGMGALDDDTRSRLEMMISATPESDAQSIINTAAPRDANGNAVLPTDEAQKKAQDLVANKAKYDEEKAKILADYFSKHQVKIGLSQFDADWDAVTIRLNQLDQDYYGKLPEYSAKPKTQADAQSRIRANLMSMLSNSKPAYTGDYDKWKSDVEAWRRNLPDIAKNVWKSISPVLGALGQPTELPEYLKNAATPAEMDKFEARFYTLDRALGAVWSKNYYDGYWAAVNGKVGKERLLAEREYYKSHALPTDKELFGWLESDIFKGRFTKSDVAARVKELGGVASIKDKLLQGKDFKAIQGDEISDLLARIPPGKEFFRFKDSLSPEMQRFLDAYTVDNYKPLTDDQKWSDFYNTLQPLLESKYANPSDDLVKEWISAEQLDKSLKADRERRWPGIGEMVTAYGPMNTAERKAYRLERPEIAAYYNWLYDEFAPNNPLWSKYYGSDSTTSADSNGSATYGNSYSKRYGGGGRSYSNGYGSSYRSYTNSEAYNDPQQRGQWIEFKSLAGDVLWGDLNNYWDAGGLLSPSATGLLQQLYSKYQFGAKDYEDWLNNVLPALRSAMLPGHNWFSDPNYFNFQYQQMPFVSNNKYWFSNTRK